MKSILSKLIARQVNNSFNQNFIKLLSGGVLAALLSILVIPITTRLYSPEDFGTFQIFLSILVILSSISSFRYEMTIVLPKSKLRTNGLIRLSFVVLIITTLIYTLVIFSLGPLFLTWISAEALIPYIYLMPIAIGVAGLYQIAQYVIIDSREFNKLSLNKVIQSSVNQSSVISFGLFSSNSTGLIISYFSGQFIAAYLLLKDYKFRKKIDRRKYLIALAFKYRKFPTVNSMNVLLNNLSIQLPVFMLAKFSTPEVVGIYMMATRLIDFPLQFLNSSASQVYIKSAADEYALAPEKLKNLYRSLLKKLSLIALVFLLSVFSFTALAVDIFLGKEWEPVSSFIYILIFGKLFQFINSPLSSTLMIINKQELGLYLIVSSLILRYFAMYLNSAEVMGMLMALSFASTLFYIIYNFISYKAIK